MKCHLAVDIGASSGRVIAFSQSDKKLELQEVHRFQNGIKDRNGHLCWDIQYLFEEILKGIECSLEEKLTPVSIGIDTWAVDFVLLDKNNKLVTDTISYRDHRTDGVMEQAFKIMSKKRLYERTGIQFQQFNTLFQLLSLKNTHPHSLKQAETILLIPDYLNFLLTGEKKCEYTNATTTQLVNAHTRDWDNEILKAFGLKKDIFPEIIAPATLVGNMKQELVEKLGVNLQVIAPATHDTASAIVSVPCHEEKTIYISSGTWSLIGVEINAPIINEHGLAFNFTNEGSMNGRFRFLKNIMGMWIIQEVRRQYDSVFSFDELVQFAKEKSDFPSIIDVNDKRFLNPIDMLQAIQDYCEETNQPIPYELGEFTQCIYKSLANSYVEAVKEIEFLQSEEYQSIFVIGGGSKNNYLNQLIANITGKTVYAGLQEATAIGNGLTQLIAMGEISDLNKARALVTNTFSREIFKQQIGGNENDYYLLRG